LKPSEDTETRSVYDFYNKDVVDAEAGNTEVVAANTRGSKVAGMNGG
jgi:hypothetical protein